MNIADIINIIVSRIRESGLSDETIQTLRLSLLFAKDAKGHRIDLKRLASFPDRDFWHDVIGIDNHASRDHKTCGLLMDCFVPRCGFVNA